MYDKHLYCKDYYRLKNMVVKILNGASVRYSASDLEEQIQESYDEGRLQAGQYDYLMGRLQEIIEI
jgi:hypothetical protein